MIEQDLKQQLKDKPKIELTESMLNHIGSTDPELRDGLIYPQFVTFILENKYSKKEIENILDRCLNNLKSDNVYERSFSVLVIAVILHQHQFNSQKLSTITTCLTLYITQETNIVGQVEDEGWVHSIAHGADAISEIAKQPHLTNNDLEKLFHVLNEKMHYDQGVFTADEDERVAVAVNTMLVNGLNNEVFIKAIQQVKTDLVNQMATGNQLYFNSRMNYKAFLRSLYFIKKEKDDHQELNQFIERTIIEISQIYY
ncbi:DUF2785 domain-containing protein [Filobacillus milosensis]|uniref:DUF2785 domain-containing protein n=1 Tax=Filobacillus milosensis TaxID=94137 RepID=A0A4Y8IN11_9BACI|nr:DUF2785 domain-containing protein [Filobacillus milosensis]TFB22807.1 DUF2785 domain-containing protein [Filobacillus milosensis]